MIGFDVDPAKVSQLNANQRTSPTSGIEAGPIRHLRSEKRSNFRRLSDPDCIIICVPTPLTLKKDPDLQYIENTGRAISKTFRASQLISMETTTQGQQTKSCWTFFKKSGREDPRNPRVLHRDEPKVVGGTRVLVLGVAYK